MAALQRPNGAGLRGPGPIPDGSLLYGFGSAHGGHPAERRRRRMRSTSPAATPASTSSFPMTRQRAGTRLPARHRPSPGRPWGVGRPLVPLRRQGKATLNPRSSSRPRLGRGRHHVGKLHGHRGLGGPPAPTVVPSYAAWGSVAILAGGLRSCGRSRAGGWSWAGPGGCRSATRS